jgi:hypothetical protein
MIDRMKLSKALEMLYQARWNVPRAADYCGLPHNEMKKILADEVSSGKLLLREWGLPTRIQLSLGL